MSFDKENTVWNQSVAGVVLHSGKVLLVRHTYGVRKGFLIVPGGFVGKGESPEDAVRREVMEETGVTVDPEAFIGIRFNSRDWYAAFRAGYVSGMPRSDNDENSEALWMDIDEALENDDVPDLTRKLILCAMRREYGFPLIPYEGTKKYGEYSFYGVCPD